MRTQDNLKIVSLNDGYEQTFWSHVSRDPLDYYFFILDLKQQPEQTKILLAMEENKVQGLMLTYADRIVHLRGKRKALEKLLERVSFERVELQVPPDCEDLILKKFTPLVRYDLVLMVLNKGDERLQIKDETVRLGPEDAEEVAGLMRRADPVWWGNITATDRKDSLETTYYIGIRRDGKIVSIGNARFDSLGSNIGVIATGERFRNMGYATSIVSSLVREILNRSPPALIHVLEHNAPAMRVYSKVGYEPFRQYLLVRGQKIQAQNNNH